MFLLHFVGARKAAKLSQQDIAQRLEKPQSYISKCQTGERRVDIIELFNYCQGLGISLTQFVEQLEQDLKQHRSEQQ